MKTNRDGERGSIMEKEEQREKRNGKERTREGNNQGEVKWKRKRRGGRKERE